MSNKGETIRTESLAIQAYAYFRQALAIGRYAPGQKIKLQEGADELGISPTPVREALFRLVSEDVLTQVDRQSVRVPIIHADRYREIRELRLLLEGDAAERAAERATRAEVEALAEIHERLCVAHEKGNPRGALIENRHFHQGLCELARMPILARMVENLWLQCGPMMNAFLIEPASVPTPATALRTRHFHVHILRALRTKNGPLAKQSIQQDILESTDRLLAYIESRRRDEERAEAQGKMKRETRTTRRRLNVVQPT